MTFTWDPSLLGSSTLQQMRATVGDNNSTDQILSDEQINWRLGQYSDSVTAAAPDVVRDILAHFARDFDRSNQGFSATRSQKVQHYRDLLADMKSESGLIAECFVGGTSKSAQDAMWDDDDWKGYQFAIEQDDNKAGNS